MSAPLLIPASRDPGDTRPDASGRVPGVHYNVPMYQPLQTQQGFDPNAALLNILSNGSYMHGGSMTQGWTGQAVGAAQSFDPRTPAGAVNLASILVPGMRGMKGQPTPGQQQFMDAIYNSSRGLPSSFRRANGDQVPDLFPHMGAPQHAPPQGNRFTPQNPLKMLTARHGASQLGAILDSPGPRGSDPFGSSDMTHQQMLDYLFRDYKGNN